MESVKTLLERLRAGDVKALARCISIVENEEPGHGELLSGLNFDRHVPVIGVTGPPGAGKSTLVEAMVTHLTGQHKKVMVAAVDPSSPFSRGALLGDRVRMTKHFNNPAVFIRSFSTRGALGGLSDKITQVLDVMQASCYDYIILETAGVGQSEVEIAGIADTVVLVLVPESGDEIQAVKSGVMEIADIFVVNKSDRAGAGSFAAEIEAFVAERKKAGNWIPPVLQTVATREQGVEEVIKQAAQHYLLTGRDRKYSILAAKAYYLIRSRRMRDIDTKTLQKQLESEMKREGFNLYEFVKKIS